MFINRRGFVPNTERELEEKFIEELYRWTETVGERVTSLESSWGITINQEQAISSLGKNILNLVPSMPIAAKSVVFEVTRFESNRVYKFKFALVAKSKADDIRRESDPISIEFIEVPGYKDNPVYERASARTDLSSYAPNGLTLIMPVSIAWRM